MFGEHQISVFQAAMIGARTSHNLLASLLESARESDRSPGGNVASEELTVLCDCTQQAERLSSDLGGQLIRGTVAAYVVFVEEFDPHEEGRLLPERFPQVFAVSKVLSRSFEMSVYQKDPIFYLFQAKEEDVVELVIYGSDRPANNEQIQIDDDLERRPEKGIAVAAFSTRERAVTWAREYCRREPEFRPGKRDKGTPQNLTLFPHLC